MKVHRLERMELDSETTVAVVKWQNVLVPFWTLSHSRKISSPPLTEPLFLLTLQILSSAVLGAPDDAETVSHHVKPATIRQVGLHSGLRYTLYVYSLCLAQFQKSSTSSGLSDSVTCWLSKEEVLHGNWVLRVAV